MPEHNAYRCHHPSIKATCWSDLIDVIVIAVHVDVDIECKHSFPSVSSRCWCLLQIITFFYPIQHSIEKD